MGNRFWLMQLIDAWNNVPHAPGSRTVGGKGGNFAMVGPNWKGTLPPGLTELRIPTNLVLIAGRTYTANKDDYPAVHALRTSTSWCRCRNGEGLHPAGQRAAQAGGRYQDAGADASAGDVAGGLFQSPERIVGANPPEPADPATMARIARLGIAPGASFSMAAFSPEVRKAIEDGVSAGQKQMREAKRGKEVNGWEITLDMGRYGTNYPYRASWTFFGVGGNLPKTPSIRSRAKDADGKVLNAANKYILRFTKAEIPPVNAFWSLTMYDSESYLVPNPSTVTRSATAAE